MRPSQGFPVLLHAVDDPYFVAVLEVRADARQLDAHGDTMAFQFWSRAYT